MKKAIKVLCIILSVLVVGLVGLGAWLYSVYSRVSDNPFSAFDKISSGGQTVEEDGTQYTFKDEMVHILILGIDSNEEREEKHKGYRSDVMILLTVDFKNNALSTISIPRDTRVEMNKLDYDTGEVTSRTTNRINAAYAFGGGPDHYGAQNAMDCTEEFLSCGGRFNIPIDLYISIDMDGIPKLVNTVGGVEVVLDRDLEGVGSKGETVTITEETADTYLRERYSGGGDDGRASRQVDFIISILKKIQDQGVLKLAPQLYSDFITYGQTNLSLEQILALASVMDDMDIDAIERYRVTGTTRSDYQIEPDTDALAEFILEHFYTSS